MSWDRARTEDKLRRLLLASQNPETHYKWAPHLAAFCEELSELSQRLRRGQRQEVLALLLEAGPYFASHGQAEDFLRWLQPFLDTASEGLLEDVFMLLCESVLSSANWGKIQDVLEDLLAYVRGRGDLPHWLAFAKAVATSVEGLYSMNRFASGDSYHRYFRSIPPEFRSMTRMYQSQAALSKARHHTRSGESSKVQGAVEELQDLYRDQPSEILRRNYAAGVVALVPELLEQEKLPEVVKQGRALLELVLRYPEDTELGAEFLHYLGASLAALLEFQEAEFFLQGLAEVLTRFRRPDLLAEKASEVLLELGEKRPELAREQIALLRLTLDKLEGSFGGGSMTLSERCVRFREITGLPPRASGCLTLVLALLALATLA